MSMTPAPGAAFVYLASASPRRRELLSQIGVRWRRVKAGVDETSLPGEAAADYVTRLALAKAREARRARQARGRRARGRDAPVIAADTAVVIDGQLLGKPADAGDCGRILGLLSGRVHEVFTAVAVISPRGESCALSRSEVSFREIGTGEIAAYWASGEPADKAGAYAIQGRGAVFVRELRGSYSGVMGLPLFETAALLAAHGVAVLDIEEPTP